MIFSEALSQALALLFNGNNNIWEVIGLSLQVSLSATLLALLIGLPISLSLTLYHFPGHRFIRMMADAFMALPPVVVGLIVYLMLSRTGPLGVWGLLYTPTAMVIAQTLLITPIVISLSQNIFETRWQQLGDQLKMLGYRRPHCFPILIQETQLSLLTVALAAGGRAIAEIGTVMIVGGNIEHQTRVMTTAIAMETRQGNLAMAVALGLVLITIAICVTLLIHGLKSYLKRK